MSGPAISVKRPVATMSMDGIAKNELYASADASIVALSSSVSLPARLNAAIQFLPGEVTHAYALELGLLVLRLRRRRLVVDHRRPLGGLHGAVAARRLLGRLRPRPVGASRDPRIASSRSRRSGSSSGAGSSATTEAVPLPDAPFVFGCPFVGGSSPVGAPTSSPRPSGRRASRPPTARRRARSRAAPGAAAPWGRS